jgi:predicted TIM-barrel fold metal-dependent hydrolase
MRIIDGHVHLIDPRRPEGVPFPKQTDALHRPTLPYHLRALGGHYGVCGAVAVEWSDRLEDNRWLLELAEADPFVVGVVGNLEAGRPGFATRLASFAKRPRFRGIRTGTPWSPLDLTSPQFMADMHALADAGLSMDAVTVGGGGPALLKDVITLNDAVPALRIVIDHLPFQAPGEALVRAELDKLLGEVASRPQIYATASNIIPRTGPIPPSPAAYWPILDRLVELFGPERLFYGSNWPVCTRVGPYELALEVVLDYFTHKRADLSEAFFVKNVRAAYGITTVG